MGKALELYLEHGLSDGWCFAHCPELPGAGYKAPSREAALALAPAMLAAELDWAARVGVLTGAATALTSGVLFAVAGEVTLDVPVGIGDTEAALEPELAPLDDTYLDFCLGYLRAARDALLGIVDRLPAGFLAWRPAEGKRTIAEILGHISDGDGFYLTRLEDAAQATAELWTHYAGPGTDPRARLDRTRGLAFERLGRLTGDDRRRVSRHEPHAETWTARKVLRRMVSHERYHTRQIVSFLTT